MGQILTRLAIKWDKLVIKVGHSDFNILLKYVVVLNILAFQCRVSFIGMLWEELSMEL